MISKRAFLLSWALLVFLADAASTAGGDELSDVRDRSHWSVSLDVTLSSKYVWRGINLVDDPVLQPAVSASFKGLTLSIWGNMELTNSNDQFGKFTEIDYVADYTWLWNSLLLSVGAIHYQFPNIGPPTTTEVYGAVGLDTLLAPSLTVYQDVDQADGTYAALSLSHTFEKVWDLTAGIAISVGLSGSIGWGSSNFNDFNYGSDNATFTDALLSAGVPIAIGDRWTLTPSVSYSTLLDGCIRNAIDKDDNVFGGLNVSYSF